MYVSQHAAADSTDDVQGFFLPLLAGAAVIVILASGCGKESSDSDKDAPGYIRFKSDGLPSSARRG